MDFEAHVESLVTYTESLSAHNRWFLHWAAPGRLFTGMGIQGGSKVPELQRRAMFSTAGGH